MLQNVGEYDDNMCTHVGANIQWCISTRQAHRNVNVHGAEYACINMLLRVF
jgi:hypothetical protein